MDKPYCIIDGKEYKLDDKLYERDVALVFPETRKQPDLNELWHKYIRKEIHLAGVFEIYVGIGLTYDFVFNYFSKSGCYGSARNIGDYLDFELFTDDEKTNEYYNDTAEEDLRTNIEDILYDIQEEIHIFDKKDIIKKLKKCIELLKE